MTDEPLDPLSKFMREREEYAKRVEKAMREAALQAAADNPDIYNPDGTQRTGPGVRCNATTRGGIRCKRRAIEGSIYCGQHLDMDADLDDPFRGWKQPR